LNLAPCAVHSGDLRDAPPPDGATEFVDLDRAAALAAGHRYAVMVVNAYSGLAFSDLSRAFAGVMLRNVVDGAGPHFDPATVELKFDVTGPHGVYLPLVVDLETNHLWWLDVSSEGEIALNNVATANAAITRIGPDLLAYFGRGVRPSMFDLATLHAVARTDEIVVREEGVTQRFARLAEESRRQLLARVRAGVDDDGLGADPLDGPAFAALLRGDLGIPAGSSTWALFRGQLTDVIAASDLLSVPASKT